MTISYTDCSLFRRPASDSSLKIMLMRHDKGRKEQERAGGEQKKLIFSPEKAAVSEAAVKR